jgi:hypothetical protein
MLQLDTNPSNTPPVLSNVSVPTYIGPRMNGAMIHVPVGDQGILVLIGGQMTDVPTPYGIGIQNANAGNTNINNSFVDIFDIETGYWFRQDTFGVPDIPTGRSDICTILVTAEDKSSFNIFMIAGVGKFCFFSLASPPHTKRIRNLQQRNCLRRHVKPLLPIQV